MRLRPDGVCPCRWKLLILVAMVLPCVSADLRAQACLSIPLQGLPSSVEAGERIRLTAELTTDCNFKVVDQATLICQFSDGEQVRQPLALAPRQGYTRAEVEVVIPDVDPGATGECFIEFVQCNQEARTCGVELAARGWDRARPPARPPAPRPSPVPHPSPSGRAGSGSPAPSVGSTPRGGGLGTFLKGLGWIGVAVGLASYADASSKEEEGLTAEADDAEKLGNQVLLASGALLLLGHSVDANGFVADDSQPSPRRFRPMLAIDPVHRAVALHVSITFD